MEPRKLVVIASLLALFSGVAAAEAVGTSTIGVAVEQMDQVLNGYSAKKDLLGKGVENDKSQKIGKIEDIVVTPNDKVSAAIIGVGGFIGVGKHDVAIPMEQLKVDGKRVVLAGATKETLKSMPKFEYTRK